MWNAKLCAAVFAAGGMLVSAAGHAADMSASKGDIAKVWAREESYWRAVQDNRDGDYRALFNSGFRGWPCGDLSTRTKSELSMTAIQATSGPVAVERQGQSWRPGVVVVYYRTRTTTKGADGTPAVVTRNFTHTWIKDRSDWTIVGGMCRVETPASK